MFNKKLPTNKELVTDYAPKYDENNVLTKCVKGIKLVGMGAAKLLAILYVVAKSPLVPTGYKALAVGALAYFGIPVDAIPDILPMIGYSDDIAVMGSAVAAIAHCLNAPILAEVNEKLIEWFPNEAADLAKDVTDLVNK